MEKRQEHSSGVALPQVVRRKGRSSVHDQQAILSTGAHVFLTCYRREKLYAEPREQVNLPTARMSCTAVAVLCWNCEQHDERRSREL